MILHATPLAGLQVVTRPGMVDHRGSFRRLFCEAELATLLQSRRIVQINHSRTRLAGAVRGLHFQHPPHAEIKFVRCLRGRVFDVAVDLRAGSPTFLRWHGEVLEPNEGKMLVIPEGFAHGFQALVPESELLYLHTAAYAPASEGGVRFDDPALGIAWPLDAADLSARDKGHPLLSPNFSGIVL